MKIIKAHCVRHDKWFKLAVNDSGEIINFENISYEAAKACQTQIKETSFRTAASLRPCMQCGSRKVGRCSHVEKWGCCGQPYFYQCLYCDQLRISREAADSRYSQYMGQSNIVGAELDKYGNPLGEKYDLAKRDSFKGFRIVMLCLDHELQTGGIYQKDFLECSPPALKEKGFDLTIINLLDQEYFGKDGKINATRLREVLENSSQLWVISGTQCYLGADAVDVIINYYKAGHGLYLWGDNDPFSADANQLGQKLFGVTMHGDYNGEHVVGVKEGREKSGIIPGHAISTGIAHFYEGITIAAVQTNSQVKPLVYSSDGKVVTAYSESFNSRLLFDGGFTRLFYKWDSAGTGRFVTNCAAWLANAENQEASEVPFT